MMKQKATKLLSVLLSLVLALSMMPGLSMTASAVSVGYEFTHGSDSNFGNAYYVTNDQDSSSKAEFTSYSTYFSSSYISGPTYESGTNQWQYSVGFIGKSWTVKLTAPDGKKSDDVIPVGFKIMSGRGTADEPYNLELMYHDHDNIIFEPWTTSNALPTSSGSYYLTADVQLTSTWNVHTGTTNLCLNGHGIKYTGDSNASVITVGSDVTLNLYDCPQDKTGTITGGKGTDTDKYQYGGGVNVNGGTFNMYGGKITACQASNGGGVAVWKNGVFNLYNGAINENKAASTDTSVSLHGGAVFITENGTFNMYDGVISGNTTRHGAVSLLNDSTAVLSGGKITGTVPVGDDLTGQGVHTNGSQGKVNLTVSGDVEITGNKYGISLEGSDNDTFNLSGTAKITGNTNSDVYLKNGTVLTIGQDFSHTDEMKIYMEYPGVFTTGMIESQTVNFTSAKVGYVVTTTDEHQAQLVSKQTQTITAENVTATYGDTDKSVSGETTGDGTIGYAVKSGSENYIDVASDGKLTIKAVPTDGKAYVTVTAAETDTYAAAAKDITVTISKAALTVKAKDQSIYVGGTVPTLDGADFYTVTGLVGSDTLTNAPTLAYQKDGDAATPDNSQAGTYDIVPSGAAAGDNYTISYENGTLTISRRSSSTPSTPTTTVTVPVSGDEETVSVTVRVSGTTATITSADVDKVLEAEDVGTVTIDVSALKQDVTEVVIPGAMVDKIADAVADEDSNADGMEIKMPSGTVAFDADAVAAIAEQANGKDLRLNLEDIGESKLNTAQQSTVKDMDVQEVLDAYMTAGGQRISDFKGGKATVTVSYTLKDGQTGRGMIVWYVAEDGSKTKVPTTCDGEIVSFTVEHFSNYVIAYENRPFADVAEGAWEYNAVYYCYDNGYFYGTSDNHFTPGGTMTRAMFATVLYRIAGEPEVTGENPFTDVEAGKWYTDAVIWAASENVIEGYGNGLFGTNDPVTREQMVAILYRYAQSRGIDVSVGEDTNILDYNDALEVSGWAVTAMQWAVGAGVINGKDNGILDPKGTATRAEVAQIVMNYDTEVK